MKIFAISDLHLSFNENIDKPMDSFGPEWEDHARRLKENWVDLITDDDLVLIPGDISWGLKLEEAMADFDWIHNLPGRKIISKGNHDLWWGRIGHLNTLYDDITFLQNDCFLLEEENIAITASRGWPYPGSDEYTEHDEKIYSRELQRMRLGLDAAAAKAPGARLIVCLHYPPTDPSGRITGFTDILEEYGVWKCIYGHLHGYASFKRGYRGELRGVQYQLVSLDYLGTVPKLIYETENLEGNTQK
ncbi:MAG: metallophosphoesterase [Mogibacterium sp.]|nr:metallophosphoesterase [Mogibacterium sp.]